MNRSKVNSSIHNFRQNWNLQEKVLSCIDLNKQLGQRGGGADVMTVQCAILKLQDRR